MALRGGGTTNDWSFIQRRGGQGRQGWDADEPCPPLSGDR